MIEAATWIIPVAVRKESNILTFSTTELLDTSLLSDWLLRSAWSLWWAAPSPNYLKAARADIACHADPGQLSYHYGEPRRPHPCQKQTNGSSSRFDQWQKLSESIYLSTFLYMSTKTGIYWVQTTDSKEGGEGRYTKTIHVNLTIYLSIYLSISIYPLS